MLQAQQDTKSGSNESEQITMEAYMAADYLSQACFLTFTSQALLHSRQLNTPNNNNRSIVPVDRLKFSLQKWFVGVRVS